MQRRKLEVEKQHVYAKVQLENFHSKFMSLLRQVRSDSYVTLCVKKFEKINCKGLQV